MSKITEILDDFSIVIFFCFFFQHFTCFAHNLWTDKARNARLVSFQRSFQDLSNRHLFHDSPLKNKHRHCHEHFGEFFLHVFSWSHLVLWSILTSLWSAVSVGQYISFFNIFIFSVFCLIALTLLLLNSERALWALSLIKSACRKKLSK